MTPNGVTPLKVQLRPVIVGYTVELIEGDPATMVELYKAAGAKNPFFARGRSYVDAYQRLTAAADLIGLQVIREDQMGRLSLAPHLKDKPRIKTR